MSYPVLAVVDKQSEQSIIWHVQTDPKAPANLSGAWIVEDESSLLEATTVVRVGTDAVAKLATAIDDDVAGLQAAAVAAKKENSSITLPRFPQLEHPDLAAIAETFHGEEIAREAWAHAVALAEIVDYWHELETARRLRKYLVEDYGEDVRPLPLAVITSG